MYIYFILKTASISSYFQRIFDRKKAPVSLDASFFRKTSWDDTARVSLWLFKAFFVNCAVDLDKIRGLIRRG